MTPKNKLTIQQIVEKISKICPNVSLDESTYVNTKTKCRFIDNQYGEFWTKPEYILSGDTKGHPAGKWDRQKETNLKKFGASNYFKSKDFKKKDNKANRKTFEEVLHKIQQLNPKLTIVQETYTNMHGKCLMIEEGVGEFWCAPHLIINQGRSPHHPKTIRERTKKTNQAKYGTDYYQQSEVSKEIVNKKTRNRVDIIQEKIVIKEIKNWIMENGIECQKGRIDGCEMDIYIPKLKLAIEYNGLHWHSEKFKDKNYHFNKTQKLASKGIRLIHIWEHEWLTRKKQCKNFLSGALGLGKTVGARKCKFEIISTDLAKKFCNKNHIQKNPNNTKLAIGCFFNESLIGVATFGLNPRNSKEINLTRLCFSDGTHVSGALSKFSKIAKHFFNMPIYTFVHIAKSNGESYVKAGWIKVKQLGPDYFYWDSKKYIVVSKQSRKKTPKNLTEHEYAKQDGLYRVYDCGKIKLQFN